MRMTVCDYLSGEKKVYTQKPQSSPWGTVQGKTKHLKGVSFVSTSSHGGLLVAKGFAAKNFSQAAIKRGFVWNGYIAYEEDCDIVVALFELPQLEKHFTSSRQGMIKSLSRYHSDYLLEVGVEPDPQIYKEFLETQQFRKLRDEKHPDLIISALGITDNVTKVWTADDKIHYVTAESYRNRVGSVHFLSKFEAVMYFDEVVKHFEEVAQASL